MTSFNVNVEIRNERVANVESEIRNGQAVSFGNKVVEFKASRFHIDNKRASVAEVRELITEHVENAMYDEFEQAQKHEAMYAGATQLANEIDEFKEQHGTEMKISDVAALLDLSEVRIRRMAVNNQLVYGSRGTITTDSVIAELRRRDEKANAPKATKVKVQKLGTASDEA